MIDQHVHTNFSPDSLVSIDEYLLEVKRYKNEYLTTTDHFDFRKVLKSKSFDEYKTIFQSSFDYIKNKELNNVKIGIEVGYNNNTIDEINEFLSNFDFSIVLLSVHDNDLISLPYSGVSRTNISNDEAVKMYINQLEDAVSNIDNFDVLTHIGYIFRYINNINPLEYVSLFDNLLKSLAQKEKALEFNTGCLRYGANNIKMFYLEIFTNFKNFGGKYVSIGSDSHDLKAYSYGFEYAYAILRKAGFTSTTQIIDRKFNLVDIPLLPKIIDQHLHTNYSPDSNVKISDYLENMEVFDSHVLTITDHLDILYNIEKFPDHNFKNAFERLFKEITDERVKIGIEVGYNKNVEEEIIEVLNKHDFSVILLSIHENDVEGFKYTRAVENVSSEEKVKMYIDQMKEAILSKVDFDVLAHLGFALRLGTKMNVLDTVSWFDEILKLLATSNKALEFNTACFYYNTPNIEQFYYQIFSNFLKYGGKYVTIGSDSHDVSTYARDYLFAINMLKEIGFDNITFVVDRQFNLEKI